MEKKKLLLIVPGLSQGGLERVCVRTARILEPYFDITIAVFDLRNAAYDLTGLDVRSLDAPAVPGKIGKLCNVLRRARRLRRLKKELQADISYSLGPTANKANAAAGGPGALWCGLRSYADLQENPSLPYVLKKADQVICCSKMIEHDLQENYGCKKATVLYNPYNSTEILEAAKQTPEGFPDFTGKKLIVTMGRADDYKAYWRLIRSFSLVYKQRPDARLMIVGNGDFGEYEQLAEECGVRDAVFFTGLQKNPFSWIARGDLYVLSSRNEGFPNALVEAMTLGLPVLATNCPSGPAEILTDRYEEMRSITEPVNDGYGVLFPDMRFEKNMDASAIFPEEVRFAEEILALLADEEKRKELGKAAAQRAAAYSEEAYAEKLIKLAENLPAKKKKRG